MPDDQPNHFSPEVYHTEAGDIQVYMDAANATAWTTQGSIAKLFGRDQSVISRHIKELYADGEIEAESTMQKMQIASSDKPVSLYNLDVVFGIMFSVKSDEARSFRKWARKRLSEIAVNGFSIDEGRLAHDPEAVERLAEIVRRHRCSEQSMYQTVRDVFKASASDYDDDSAKIRAFFALIQDKFHYAVTEKTAAQVILDRVDAKKKDCGLRTVKGMVPTVPEAKVAKNYYSPEELQGLENICEQFLLFAKSKIFRGQKMTMEELSTKLNILLMANDYPVLYEYKEYLRDKADEKAAAEVKKYQAALKGKKNQPLPNGDGHPDEND